MKQGTILLGWVLRYLCSEHYTVRFAAVSNASCTVRIEIDSTTVQSYAMSRCPMLPHLFYTSVQLIYTHVSSTLVPGHTKPTENHALLIRHSMMPAFMLGVRHVPWKGTCLFRALDWPPNGETLTTVSTINMMHWNRTDSMLWFQWFGPHKKGPVQGARFLGVGPWYLCVFWPNFCRKIWAKARSPAPFCCSASVFIWSCPQPLGSFCDHTGWL